MWTAEQTETHLFADAHLRQIVDVTFREVARRIREKVHTTELDIQDFIWNQYEERDMTSSHRPIVAASTRIVPIRITSRTVSTISNERRRFPAHRHLGKEKGRAFRL